MRKKNGFTLVELLAVIVILAIIMIIAIPNVLEATAKAKKQSFFLYAESIQGKAVAKYIADNNEDTDSTDGVVCKVYDVKQLTTNDNLTKEEIENDNKNSSKDYEGWAKVERVTKPSSTVGKVSFDVTSTGDIKYIKYCISDNASGTCTPNKTYGFAAKESEDDPEVKKVHIEKNLSFDEGENHIHKMCVEYQYVDGGMLKTGKITPCIGASSNVDENGNPKPNAVTEYAYKTTLTIKSKDYTVENLIFEDNMSRNKFFDAIDELKAKRKAENRVDDLTIASPTCGVDTPDIKGSTTTHANAETQTTTTHHTGVTENPYDCPKLTPSDETFRVILNTNGGEAADGITSFTSCDSCDTAIEEPTREGYLFVHWYYDKKFEKEVIGNKIADIIKEPKYNTSNCIIGYKDINIYAKWEIDKDKTTVKTTKEFSTTTAEDKTTQMITIETTTVDVSDETILLDSLSVAGQEINFTPTTFYYDITIPSTVESLDLAYQVHSPDTTDAVVSGNENLSKGRNFVQVILQNRFTGAKATYTVTVTNLGAVEQRITQPTSPNQTEWDPESGLPDPTLEASNASLKSLSVSSHVIDFDANRYEYIVPIYSSDPLNIEAVAAATGAYINIDGNKDLKDGDIISIYVQSPNGYYNKTYKIEVKYDKQKSNTTKYLRTLVVILGIVLAAMLIISYLNKKKNFSIIRKTDADENKENQIANELNANSEPATGIAATIPGMNPDATETPVSANVIPGMNVTENNETPTGDANQVNQSASQPSETQVNNSTNVIPGMVVDNNESSDNNSVVK